MEPSPEPLSRDEGVAYKGVLRYARIFQDLLQRDCVFVRASNITGLGLQGLEFWASGRQRAIARCDAIFGERLIFSSAFKHSVMYTCSSAALSLTLAA